MSGDARHAINQCGNVVYPRAPQISLVIAGTGAAMS
jgi:hypothetical protein